MSYISFAELRIPQEAGPGSHGVQTHPPSEWRREITTVLAEDKKRKTVALTKEKLENAPLILARARHAQEPSGDIFSQSFLFII